MGTRSCIALFTGNGYRSVYCHWDGYPEHHGAILAEHYDEAQTEKLLSQGDLSSLGKTIGRKHDFDKRIEGSKVCTFYKRDRGEVGTEARTSETFTDLAALALESGAEYLYIFRGGAWHFAPVGSLPPRECDLQRVDLAKLKREERRERLARFEEYAEGLTVLDTPLAGDLSNGEAFSRRYQAPGKGLTKNHRDWLKLLGQLGFAWTYDQRRHSLRLDHPGDERRALRAAKV